MEQRKTPQVRLREAKPDKSRYAGNGLFMNAVNADVGIPPGAVKLKFLQN